MKGSLSPHLRDVLESPKPHARLDDDDDALPSPSDGEYLAYGLPANKPLVSIHFIKPDGTIRSFQYRHLDSDTLYAAGVITLRFIGLRATQVILRGRNLKQLHYYIHQDRIRFVMEATRDFGADDEPIVSKIDISELAEQ
jgi:hypothetical protein